MADTIQNYKCPCCDAPLVFDAGKQNLHCEFCGTDVDLTTMQKLDEANELGMTSSKYDWEHYEPRSFGNDEGVNFSTYSCPACGAAIMGDASMVSTVCPYCGNATIVKGQFEGSLRPDYVIPFKVDKKGAMAALAEVCQNAPFLPDEFKDKKKIEEMAGVYVPFWMFDCDCNADIRYNAKKVTYWSDSNYEYTKTDFFKLVRSGTLSFANIPVDGSRKADDTYMEAIEPFDYKEAVDFNPAYLSGYLADKYDVTAEESIEHANERVRKSTESVFASTAKGYLGVVPENSFVSFSEGKIRYALLPVWMLNIKYQGQNYKYAINGQTGKTVGEYPVCRKKRNAYFAKVFGIALGLSLAVALAYIKLF